MEQGGASVLDIAARLLREVVDGVPPLGALGARLADLADVLEVDRVVVAIDDPQFGRQLFSSGRRALGECHAGLRGPERVCTDPPLPIEGRAEAMLVNVVRTAFTLALERGRSTMTDRQRLVELTAAVGTATARAVRYGWGFTLAVVGFEVGSDHGAAPAAPSLRAGLRAGDAVADLGLGRFGFMIEATLDDQVPAILARIACRDDLAPFSFGLVCCPGDGTDASALVERGLERLRDAKRSGGGGTGGIRAGRPG
jgi:hypothetical protein